MFSNPFNSKIVADITKFLSEHRNNIDIDPCLNEAAEKTAAQIGDEMILEDRRSLLRDRFNEAVSDCGCRGTTKEANAFAKAVEMHIEEVTGNTRLEESVTGGFAKIFLLSRTKSRIRGNEKWYTVVFSRDTKDANTILATSEAGTKKISLKEFVEWCDKFPNASRNDKYHFAHDYSDGGYDYEWFIGPYWTNKFIGVSEEGSYIWLDNGLYPKAYPHPAWLKKVKQLAMGGVGESVEMHIREGKKSLPPAFLKNIQKKKDAAKKKDGEDKKEEVQVDENLKDGFYGYRIDPEGGKFVLYQLHHNRGSVTGTVIGRFATKDEAIAKYEAIQAAKYEARAKAKKDAAAKKEDVEEGFAQPTEKELRASVKWLESILKDPKKLKDSGLSREDAEDNLAAAKDMLSFGKAHGSKIKP